VSTISGPARRTETASGSSLRASRLSAIEVPGGAALCHHQQQTSRSVARAEDWRKLVEAGKRKGQAPLDRIAVPHKVASATKTSLYLLAVPSEGCNGCCTPNMGRSRRMRDAEVESMAGRKSSVTANTDQPLTAAEVSRLTPIGPTKRPPVGSILRGRHSLFFTQVPENGRDWQ
jgi:hypothetical protein